MAKPKEDEMYNDQMWLKLGEQRAAELRKEADQHRLANSVRRIPPSFDRARVLAGVWVTALGAVLLLVVR
jgi:hypothetical protein